jgi:pyruvate formate lyase activating enzyme
MHEASIYEKMPDGGILCSLCPHNCRLSIGKTGICGVRTNIEGRLIAENYGKLTAIHSDPIEKKPLYHFFPGRSILSIGSIGCNLKCAFCQNCEISQSKVSDFPDLRSYTPESILKMAISDPDSIGIAYTYNEPAVFYEFMMDTAFLVKKAGLKNVIVTNGYINKQPLAELLEYLDAFNVDLKGFNDGFFKKYTHSSMRPVLDTLIQIRKSGKHLEITNLVIPSLNDDAGTFREMVKWIAKELGIHTILHLSKYFPRYKFSVASTSVSTLLQLASIAREFLTYVYVGNVYLSDQQDTTCHNCQSLLIKRRGYTVEITGIKSDGSCKNCNAKIAVLD